MDDVMGPYETRAEAAAEPMPREIADLHGAAPARNVVWRHLATACEQAGIDLGEYDRATLRWLCGWEPETVQVVIGLMSRAHAAGTKEETA